MEEVYYTPRKLSSEKDGAMRRPFKLSKKPLAFFDSLK